MVLIIDWKFEYVYVFRFDQVFVQTVDSIFTLRMSLSDPSLENLMEDSQLSSFQLYLCFT